MEPSDLENPASDRTELLRTAAQLGNWEEAQRLLQEDRSMLVAVITDEYETALHVATGASQTSFVTEIIQLMEPEDLEKQDGNGNTAFTIAAIAGNEDIVGVLLRRNLKLLEIGDSRGRTPLHLAVFLGKNEMATFLYHGRPDSRYLKFDDRKEIFFLSIKRDLYDLALKLAEEIPVLAVCRDENGHYALHVLARKPSSLFGWDISAKSINSCV